MGVIGLSLGAIDIVHAAARDRGLKAIVLDGLGQSGVDTQGVVLDIVVSINGRATATYTLSDPDKITFSNPQLGNLTFSATLNGKELFTGTPDEMAAMFGVSPDPKYNTFPYECSGDTLKYTPPVKNARPLTFERVP